MNKLTSMNMQRDIDILAEWSNNDTTSHDTAVDSKDAKGGITKDSQKLPYIFDDVAWHFSWAVFFLELFAHTVPFGFLTINFRAHGFVQKSIVWSFFNTGSPFIVYLMVIAYVLCRGDETAIISQALFLPIVLFFVHKVCSLLIMLHY